MLQLWQSAYTTAGATPPETWKEGIFRPEGHSVSVSDIYFIGHYLKLIATQRGEVLRFHANGVETRNGMVDAEIVVKSIGFEINEGNERLLGRSRMRPNMNVDSGLWAIFEPHLDADSNLLRSLVTSAQ